MNKIDNNGNQKDNLFIASGHSYCLASYVHLLNHYYHHVEQVHIADQVFLAFIAYFTEQTRPRNPLLDEIISYGKNILGWNDDLYSLEYSEIEDVINNKCDLNVLSLKAKELLSSIMFEYLRIFINRGVSKYNELIAFHNWLFVNNNKQEFGFSEGIIYAGIHITGPSAIITSYTQELVTMPKTDKGVLFMTKDGNEVHSLFAYYNHSDHLFHKIDPKEGVESVLDWENPHYVECILFDIDQESVKKDKSILAAMRSFDENYSLCCCYFLKSEEDRKFLGDANRKKCRFCGRTKEEGAKFKKKAHAISNLTGNKLLFSHYECDDCNAKFGIYESELAEYLKPYHSILKVKGKNGVPSYRKNKSRIDTIDDKLTINTYEGDPSIEIKIDKEKKCLNVTCTRTYVPIKVYKALLKMALTILPEEDFCNFNYIIKFINDVNEVAKGELPIIVQMYGDGNDIFEFVSAIIFKRKETAPDAVPAYWFLLAYNNFCFQMPIIGCKLDEKYNGQELTMMAAPTPPIFMGYNMTYCKKIDFSSSQKIEDEKVPLIMGFGRMEETTFS